MKTYILVENYDIVISNEWELLYKNKLRYVLKWFLNIFFKYSNLIQLSVIIGVNVL